MKYEQLAEKTECPYTKELNERLIGCNRLLHHAMGLVTEAGELLDQLKKHIFYGKELDLVNLKEEIGDNQYYAAGLCNSLQTDLETEQNRNFNKLKERYGDKFSEDAALNRNLDREREVLEQ